MFAEQRVHTRQFQHTAARRRLVRLSAGRIRYGYSFNTQPPEGGWGRVPGETSNHAGFNTQPPEGGWALVVERLSVCTKFQHTAARRRLDPQNGGIRCLSWFQHTAARRRLASFPGRFPLSASFNTQPPEGGWHVQTIRCGMQRRNVSTHSRPKAAGFSVTDFRVIMTRFQHTAARRRLALPFAAFLYCLNVSTHSRPKAAGCLSQSIVVPALFQHTAARRRLGRYSKTQRVRYYQFQHTAARRRLG